MTLAVEQFRDAIHAAGLNPPDTIEADGKLRRFPSNGKRGDDAGWYVLHNDGIPAGAFGDWRTGVTHTWRADIGRRLTPAEEAEQRAKIEAARRQRKAEEARRHAEARERAALRRRLKRALVAAGIAGIASRRAIRGVLVLLGLERT